MAATLTSPCVPLFTSPRTVYRYSPEEMLSSLAQALASGHEDTVLDLPSSLHLPLYARGGKGKTARAKCVASRPQRPELLSVLPPAFTVGVAQSVL